MAMVAALGKDRLDIADEINRPSRRRRNSGVGLLRLRGTNLPRESRRDDG
jgi:hypothetical protein